MALVTVLGCGPVGLATALLLRRAGNEVVCIDTNARLIEDCRNGRFQRMEGLTTELDFRFEDHYAREFIADHVFFCLSTPFENDGFALDSTFAALETLKRLEVTLSVKHLVFRSTFTPGTCDDILIPRVLQDWRRDQIAVSYFPEFLREKFIREDLENPPLKVVAHNGVQAKEFFRNLSLNLEDVESIRTLELLKLTSNAYHALKVTFANEVAVLAERAGVDARTVMDLFCRDKKLNVSDKYLVPGTPFGGACLDKDLLALENFGRDLELNVLKNIRPSNEARKRTDL